MATLPANMDGVSSIEGTDWVEIHGGRVVYERGKLLKTAS